MKKFLLTLAAIALFSCTAPLIANAYVNGKGEVWTDGVLLVAIGQLDADVTIKGSGVLVTFPTHVAEGQILLVDRMAGTETSMQLGTPIPMQYARLFQPNEAAEMGITFAQ